MRCPKCQSTSVKERPERTAQGYRRFRCLTCAKQFNERSTGLLNRTQYPSDVIALVVLWRLRYKLSLRDLAEMFLIRGALVHRWIGRQGASFMICIQATGRACGMPSSVIRFSTRVAITASTCCAPRLCDRSPPPRTRLSLEKVHSAALRRPYPVACSHATPPSRATCRAWHPRPVSGSSRAAARTSGALRRNTPSAFGSHCWCSATARYVGPPA